MADGNLTHPTRSYLEAFVHGNMNEDERLLVEDHLAECDVCCDVLRSVPHDALVERMRGADTTDTPAETQMMPHPVENEREEDERSIPPELVNHSRYKIVKELGAGGMGVVYQAEHRLMERPVALKVISSRLVNSDIAVERFRLEVKAAAKLSHRNIVAAFDAEQAGDLHFLVMEFIEGVSLSDVVKRRGRLSVLHACNYVMQAAQGLQHALEKGMVHRDIKPQNLMRTEKGTIKILDFGLARFASQQNVQSENTELTGAGATLGTPDYISPEQARDSRQADIRSDIYSLGCTLYYLLAGRVPFPEGTAMEKVISHCKEQPTPLSELREDIPDDLARIVQRMTAKQAEERFQTPSEVVEALRPFGKPETSDDQVTIDTATTKPLEESTANTFVEMSPTLAPLEQLDPLDIQQAELQSPALPQPFITKQQPTTDWRSLVGRYRTILVTGAALVFLVVLLTVLFPTVKEKLTGNEWIDLLEQVDTTRDAIGGTWQKRGGELLVENEQGARIILPYQPPAEYDFEVQFTRRTGIHSIALVFTAGKGQAAFELDAWGEHLAGIQNINGQTIRERENSTHIEDVELTNGRSYTAMVRVRQGSVTAYLNGEKLTEYIGDGSNLSVLELWNLQDTQRLGVGAYESDTTFHRIRVRPWK